MNNKSVLLSKSTDFSIRIINLYKYLNEEKCETTLSKQVLRCGTSIGANINEANYAQSKADFISKLHIALKETAETEYWLYLLRKTSYLTNEMYDSIIPDCMEIKRILISSINTAKTNTD